MILGGLIAATNLQVALVLDWGICEFDMLRHRLLQRRMHYEFSKKNLLG